MLDLKIEKLESESTHSGTRCKKGRDGNTVQLKGKYRTASPSRLVRQTFATFDLHATLHEKGLCYATVWRVAFTSFVLRAAAAAAAA